MSDTNRSSRLPRTLYVCPYPPSKIGGGTVILRHLFQRFPKQSLWMLLARPIVNRAEQLDGEPLPWNYDTAPWLSRESKGFLWRLLRYPNLLLVPLIVFRGLRMVRRHRIQAIFTTPLDGEFFIAAYLMHRITGLPLFVYVMDVWSESYSKTGRIGGRVASYFEPRIINAAQHFWTIGPHMTQYYKIRYGVTGDSLPNMVDVETYALGRTKATAEKPSLGDQVRIVLTGSIYRMNLDALRNLMAVLESEQSEEGRLHNVTLELYTTQSHADLEKYCSIVPTPWLKISYADLEAIPGVQCGADILFLPMTFSDGYRNLISTSFLAKLPEYLASGTPVLVHAPSYSTASKFVRQHECGLVVDTEDPSELLGAITRLSTDQALRSQLSSNAVNLAERDYDKREIQARFLNAFSNGTKC